MDVTETALPGGGDRPLSVGFADSSPQRGEPRAPEVGEKVKFTPAAYLGKSDGFCEDLTIEVTGEIVQVNEARRWYRVQYEVRPGCIRFETFKY